MSTSKRYTNMDRISGLRLPVLQEDIDYAVPRNQFNCAIVKAVQRRFPTALRVRANSKKIAFTLPEDDLRYTYPTPESAVETIIKPLDSFKVPQPMVLSLRGGTARLCDHDSDGRKGRKERDRMREYPLSKKDSWPSRQLQKDRPVASAAAGYERYCPDQ